MKNNQSKIFLIGGVVLILLVGAYFVFSKKDSQKIPDTVTSENQTETKTPKTNEAITSIQDLLSRSGSLKCVYTDAMGDEVTSYIKNGSIRTDSYNPTGKEEGGAIMKDGWVYVWEKKRGEGFKMTYDLNKDNKQNGDPNSYASFGGTDFVKQLEKFQESCVSASIDDKLFELPPGVSFTDYSELIGKIKNPQTR